MKLSDHAIRRILFELSHRGEPGFRHIVWVKPDGSDATVRRGSDPPDVDEWVSGGCMEAILRRGIEWED